jgi:CRP-like cAMP-binding protein/Fe-S-cluster-containing hydrogenase component 2
VSNHPVSEKIPPWLLWQRLSRLEIFESFSDDQRDAFLKAYENEPAIRLRTFKTGDIICRKGEYELDLCFILTGAVDLIDRYGEKDQVFVIGLEAGNIYGELGAIGGLPRTLDVIAHTDCEIFYVPRHALKYLEQNNHAREIPVVLQGEPGDAFYIVRDGFVQVVREEDDGNRRVLAYLRTGEYFGEMALFETGTRWASVLTAGKCELIKIRRDDFLELCRHYPRIEASARKVIEQRFEQERTVTAEISDLLERSGQLGVIQADALLVMDLDLCIKCDACVKACESLHGKSRLIRNGIQLGKYLVPSACRHCDDPKCMNSCPTGAIKRRPEGEIYFQYDMCIGCGNCAIACPYDNIAMIDTPIFDKAQARKSHIMNDSNFFRPYPAAAHDVGETGLRGHLYTQGQGRQRLGC